MGTAANTLKKERYRKLHSNDKNVKRSYCHE